MIMKFSLTLATALFIPVLVNAQNQNGSITVSGVLSAVSIICSIDAPQVQVGAGGNLAYSPSNFTASNGTNVTFIFSTYESHHCCLYAMLIMMRVLCRSPIPHSVTEGSFGNPCVYLNGTDGAGFDSGLQTGKQFTIQITNDQERKQTSCHFFPLWPNDFHTTAVWFYCKTTGHCGLEWLGEFF